MVSISLVDHIYLHVLFTEFVRDTLADPACASRDDRHFPRLLLPRRVCFLNRLFYRLSLVILPFCSLDHPDTFDQFLIPLQSIPDAIL